MFAAQSRWTNGNASIDGKPPEEVRTRLVSGDYFTVLGATALRGPRIHGRRRTRPRHGPLRRDQLRISGSGVSAARPPRSDSRIRIAKADLTIIGVAPPHFLGENVGAAPDFWIPLDMQPQVMPGRMWLRDDPGAHRRKGDVAACHRPPEARRLAAAGASQRGCGLQAGGGRGILRAQPEPARHSEAEPEAARCRHRRLQPARRFRRPAVRADGGGGAGAGDRLRQRGQPAAGARHGAAEGDGRAAGAGRRTRAASCASFSPRA